MTPAPTLSSAPEDATLSDEQQAVIERALRGENLFITGNAGTGKSFLLHHLKDLLGPQLTAATGVAALQLKGETIHSWAGLGIGGKSAREIVAGLREAAGAGPSVDPMMLVKRKAAELSTAMALIHGGEWSAQIDHDFRLIVIRPA